MQRNNGQGFKSDVGKWSRKAEPWKNAGRIIKNVGRAKKKLHLGRGHDSGKSNGR
jgi:hypothetical protein